MRRLAYIGDAISQLLNVMFLPDIGDTTANESISGRSYRKNWRIMQKMINGIFFFQEEHCKQAFYNDLMRAKEITSKFRGENVD